VSASLDFLKALKWSRKYGLRINLDLHSVPGSQKYALSLLSSPLLSSPLSLSRDRADRVCVD